MLTMDKFIKEKVSSIKSKLKRQSRINQDRARIRPEELGRSEYSEYITHTIRR